MKKLVLLPYDRYQRLLSTSSTNELNILETTPSVIKQPEHEEKQAHSRVVDSTSNPDQDDGLLLQIPKSLQHRARTLLGYLKPYLTWNPCGEVTLEGREIPHSNIVDLLKVHLKDYKEFSPPGRDAFRQLLFKINVPQSVLAPSIREQTGGSRLPPPPGTPVKRIQDSADVHMPHKWRRL